MSCKEGVQNNCCSRLESGCCKENTTLKEEMAVDNDYVVCTCMEVTYSMILQEIQRGSNTFQKLSKTLGVGTGCSSCVEEVEEIVERKIAPQKKV